MTSYETRIGNLKALLKMMTENQKLFEEALFKDLGKSAYESNQTELGIINKEIKYHIRHLKKFMKNKTIFNFIIAKYYIKDHPYKDALIISPWNYPVYLSILPIVGALSAGVKVTLKPSEITVNTEKLLAKLVPMYFDKDVIEVVCGDASVTTELIHRNYDVIFFTGSTHVGKIIARQASEYLSKLILELGGKSPVIVTKNANIKKLVQKVVWAKTMNSGQTCIAPDYLLVDSSIYEQVIDEFRNVDTDTMYKIVNENHYNRLKSHLNNVVIGGKFDDETKSMGLTISTTQIDEEIFGPILPIITYNSNVEMYQLINKYPNPLAAYLFTDDKNEHEILDNFNFGSACINDLILQIYPHNVPFGGVKESGNGRYHGKYSYKAFVHEKTYFKTFAKFDVKFRYEKE